ncbi:hypothetical protein D3C73_1398030 [compost metagenome]
MHHVPECKHLVKAVLLLFLAFLISQVRPRDIEFVFRSISIPFLFTEFVQVIFELFSPVDTGRLDKDPEKHTVLIQNFKSKLPIIIGI